MLPLSVVSILAFILSSVAPAASATEQEEPLPPEGIPHTRQLETPQADVSEFQELIEVLQEENGVIVSLDIPWDGSQEEVSVAAIAPPPPPAPTPEPTPEPQPEPEPLSLEEPAVLHTPDATIVETALKYEGYPYVYAGSHPDTGFDCSGFTSFIYALHGYSLPRTSTEQGSVGTLVSQEDALPGDLVVWTHGGHVAIYIGDGKIIHASTPSTGVVVGDLYGSYYFKRL